MSNGRPDALREFVQGLLAAREAHDTRLSRAYRAFWRLGNNAPLESYRLALGEIRKAEAVLPGAQVRTILKEASEAWHRETGHCPFCGGPTLHSPAEAILEGAA